MGLRERTLSLPVMMALLLSAVWRQIAAVNELARLIRDEAVLWEEPKKLLNKPFPNDSTPCRLSCFSTYSISCYP